MEFSTKADKLQPSEAGALLYVCTDACPCSSQNDDEIARVLCEQLAEGETFAALQTLQNGSLRALAVVRLKDTTRSSIEKAATEAAAGAQLQERLAICLAAL